MLQAWNLIAVCFLIFCFPASFIFSSYANNGFAEKKETIPLTKENFANLNESIGYSEQEKIPVAIKNEPILHGKMPVKCKNKAETASSQKNLKAVASAYYAPLPNQSWYAAGSYAKEKKMNGTGKLTFYGKIPQKKYTVAAHPGFIAAGSKIRIKGIKELEGIVFEVEDKGGLIIGNRVDVFMGKGEPALWEAITLGKKRVIIEVL